MRGRKSVILAGLVLGAILLSRGNALALCPADCELFWTAPTTYTDGEPIETQDLPLSYVVEWDGNLLPQTGNTSVALPKPYGHDVPHTGRVKAITARGEEGAFTDPFDWSSPKGIPAAPGLPGIGVR